LDSLYCVVLGAGYPGDGNSNIHAKCWKLLIGLQHHHTYWLRHEGQVVQDKCLSTNVFPLFTQHKTVIFN